MLSIPRIFTLFSTFFSAVIFAEYVPKWSCDFENGFCDWHHVEYKRSEVNWKLSYGHEYHIRDHTNNSTSGRFLTLTAYRDRRLTSPVIQPNNGSCKMIFYYRKITAVRYLGVLFLEIYKMTKKSYKIFREVIFRKESFPSKWTKAEINLSSDVEFQLEIYGKNGEYAIDDTLFTKGCFTNERAPIKVVMASSSSQFNFPNGMFYSMVNNSWQMVCTKEKADAACKLLGFIGVDNKSSVVETLGSSHKICLQSNERHPSAVGCYNQTGCVNATYWRCNQVYRQSCPSLNYKACTSSTACFAYDQICDYHNDCPGGEDESNCSAYNRCNFNHGFCNWVASKQKFHEWERLTRYFLEVKSRRVKGSAILRMKNFIQGTRDNYCTLRFSYQFYSPDSCRLKVRTISNKTSEVAWMSNHDTVYDDSWHRQIVELKLDDIIQVEFEGEFLRYPSGASIRLAYVSFNADCNILNENKAFPSHSNDSFFCLADGKKISRKKVCDFFPDCFGGSDEWTCTYDSERCTFDESLCNWRISEDAPAKLNDRNSYRPGPRKDHTNKYEDGNYVLFDATFGMEMGEFGYLISSWMQKPFSGKCTFRWFYNMHNGYDKGVGKLSVIYYDPIKRVQKSLWYSRGSNDSSWHYGAVTFDVVSLHYQLIMKFERGHEAYSDISVDDVSFSEECYNIQNFASISVRQVCRKSKRFFNAGKHFASVLFSSTNYTSRNINCKWYISTDSRLRISLRAEYIMIDPKDVVSIEAGSAMGRSIGGSYSGRVAPFNLVSHGNSMIVTFNAMHIKAYQGFLFNISSTDYPAAPAAANESPSGPKKLVWIRKCTDSKYTSSRRTVGTLTLSTEYLSYEDCINKFYAYDGYRIKFDFKFIRTLYHYNFLEFLNNEFDGPSKFYGNIGPFYFISKRSWLAFRFKSGLLLEPFGFLLVVSATKDLPKAVQFYHPKTKSHRSLRLTSPSTVHNVTESPVATNVTKYIPTPKAKEMDSESTDFDSHSLIAWSITGFVIAIFVFVAIKYLLWRKQRRSTRGHGAINEQPDRDIAVRYIPAAQDADPPPPYSYCGDGEVLLCPNTQLPSLDENNRADRVPHILPTNSSFEHDV